MLPAMPYIGDGRDKMGEEQIYRNLIYVSITRAIDHVNVFLPEGEKNPVIRDLVECFEKMEG